LPKHLVSSSALIDATPRRVYAVIADFRNEHSHILPKQFSHLEVEKGGFGAGTVIRYRMRVAGKTHAVRSAISEPEPGRVLVETILDGNGAVTTFTVNPGPSPGQSEVTISTELPVRSGLLGAMERFFTTRLLRPIFIRELELLAEHAGRG
jgi:Polyketide cyclase / dehydrase and lipid transport